MQTSLFQLAGAFRQLDDVLAALSDGELPPEVDALLDSLNAAVEEKIDGYGHVIRRCRLRAAEYRGLLDQIKREFDRVRAMIEAQEKAEERLKSRIMAFMLDRGVNEVAGRHERFRLVANGGKCPLKIDRDRLPDEFVRVVRQPDEAKIREAIEAGASVPGVELAERGKHVRLV